MAKTFITSCVNAEGQDIHDMIDVNTEITRRTFVKHTDRQSRLTLEQDLGYSPDFRISKDWHVSYHKSTYQGRPCVYLRWSAIEHIFV